MLALGVCLSLALVCGCRSTADVDGEGDAEIRSLDPGRQSPMLDRLRHSNRQAARADKADDIARLRQDLAEVEKDIETGRARGEDTVSREAQRENLTRTIEHEERMLGTIEESMR